jgi:hypothetical protein
MTLYRTDSQIVEQTEKIATIIATTFFGSTLVSGAYRDATSPRAILCWDFACLMQQELTATDVVDAVMGLDDVDSGEDTEFPTRELGSQATPSSVTNLVRSIPCADKWLTEPDKVSQEWKDGWNAAIHHLRRLLPICANRQ